MQTNGPCDPLAKRVAHRLGSGEGVTGVPHPWEQMADIVHEPGHGKLDIVGELLPQESGRLQSVVQVGERHRSR